MANTNHYDAAITEELSKAATEIGAERYAHETNDEFGYRIIALIEDAIDGHEAEIAHLDRLRQTVKTLL
jgi:hypothetical protein